MKDVFEISEEMKRRFETDRTEENLRKFVMAELLAPICDYYHAMDLIKENILMVTDNRLLYLGADLCFGWNPNDKFFMDILNQKIVSATDEEKAIIYYLNALGIGTCKAFRDSDCMKRYRSYLQKSVDYSSKMGFALNRVYLAEISPKRKAMLLLREGKTNVRYILTDADIEKLPYEYYLDIQNYIDSYITGICMSEFSYERRFGPEALRKIISK